MKITFNNFSFKNILKINNRLQENPLSGFNTDNILLTAEKDHLTFTVSNGLTVIKTLLKETAYPGLKIEQAGKALVKTKNLVSLLNNLEKLGDSNFAIVKNETQIEIKSPNSTSYLNLIREDHFPNVNYDLENYEEITIDGVFFKNALSRFKNIVANTKQDNKILSMVCFKREDTQTIELVASDGIKLTHFRKQAEGKNFHLLFDQNIIDLINEINIENYQQISFLISNQNILIKTNNHILITRNYTENYPNYKKLWEIPTVHKYIFDKKKMMSAIESSSIFADNDKKWLVHFEFEKDKINLHSNNQEIGKSFCSLENENKNVDNKIIITFEGNSFLQVLKNFNNKKITIFLNNNLVPAVLLDEQEAEITQFLNPIKVFN